MRIAILTFHRAYNCGAMLQAWALKTVLERMGHTVEFPACNSVGVTERWRYPVVHSGKSGLAWFRSAVGRSLINLLSVPSEDILRHRYKVFRERYIPERRCLPADFNKHYDLIIVGSDQVWNEDLLQNDAPMFFGENLPTDVYRIVYAASYGDLPLAENKIKRVVGALENFSAISVREKLAKDQLAAFSNISITETLDPTLLLDAADYDEIACGSFQSEPYLFMYTLSTESFFVDTAKALAGKLGVRCVIAPCHQYSRFGAPRGLTYGLSPDRLVQYVRNAKYVITNSFHGTVMSVVFNKPFLSLRGQVDAFESRPASLLRKIGAIERLVNPTVSVDDMLLRLISSPLVNLNMIGEMRSESMAWLEEAVRL